MRKAIWVVAFSAAYWLGAACAWAVPPFGRDDARINMVVMDPLSSPLACDCVQGYAQRKYEDLATHIEKATGLTVRVVWSESLEVVSKNEPQRRIDLIIGKDSVVRSQAAECKLRITPLASLTDKQGLKVQKGLFVVAAHSKAASLLDLDGFEVLFGPAAAEEKSGAAKLLLKEIELEVKAGETCPTCSIAAKKILAAGNDSRQAAVISSYAAPLLEGCGTIKKGDLRVVGETEPVPFISVFANHASPQADIRIVEACLMKAKDSPKLLASLESRDGFVPYDWPKTSNARHDASAEVSADTSAKKN